MWKQIRIKVFGVLNIGAHAPHHVVKDDSIAVTMISSEHHVHHGGHLDFARLFIHDRLFLDLASAGKSHGSHRRTQRGHTSGEAERTYVGDHDLAHSVFIADSRNIYTDIKSEVG